MFDAKSDLLSCFERRIEYTNVISGRLMLEHTQQSRDPETRHETKHKRSKMMKPEMAAKINWNV